MMENRRLWLEEGNLMDGGNPFAANPNNETHDSVFEKFAQKPPQKGLVTIASNALVVGQEFVLTALVLARHREAFLNEANPHRIDKDSDYAQRVAISIGCISLALFLVILYNSQVAPFSSSSSSSTAENPAPQSRKSKVRQRFTDAILMGILLRFLAAVLRTLTASYSSDTVHALAVVTFILHLLACDYSYANGFDDGNNIQDDDEADKTRLHSTDARPTFEGGTISLTAAFFGTTLLASRLESNGSVYAFVSSSVILFALYPAARHQVARQTQKSNRWVPLVITSILTAGTFVLFDSSEKMFAGAILATICIVAPIWKFWLQSYKVTLRGPWDLPHIPT